jgi:undecaprenyl diphosphate synthase
MDGNGRWAQEKRLPRIAGHHEGTKRVKEIVKAAREMGLEAITFFAFSTENWVRPKHEVAVLLHYFESFLRKELPGMMKSNIRFKVIGRGHPVPNRLLEKIRAAELKTQDNTGLIFILAINYGGRQEIVDTTRKICKLALAGKLEVDDLDVEEFSRHLYTAGIPDPDLLIRTSGEIRLSNFLLWQLSYAEMYFPKVYWPDFKREEFDAAVKEFQRRQRRFGNIPETGKK